MASIAELKRQKAALKAKMQELAIKEALTDDESKEFDDLESQVADHEKRICRMETAFAGSETAPVENDMDEDGTENAGKAYRDAINKGFVTSNVVIKDARPKGERKGTRMARFVTGVGLGMKHRDVNAGADFVRDNFNDKEVAKAVRDHKIMKAAQSAGAQTTGGALIPQDFRAELIDLLWSETVVRNAGAQVYQANMGQMTLPRQNGASTAYWQGENAAITASNGTFDDIQFTAKNLTALVPVSNRLIRYSPMAVDQIVLDEMIEQLARAEDLAFLTGSVSSTQPGGLVYYTPTAGVVTPVSISGLSGAPLVQALTQTLLALKGALEYTNVPLDGACWYSNPTVFNYLAGVTDGIGGFPFREELNKGELLGFKVMKTNLIPTDLGTSGALGAYLIFSQPRKQVIVESMDILTNISDVSGYNASGAPIFAQQNDQTVFTLIEAVDFNLKNPQAAAYAIVPWATAGYTPNAGIQYSTQTANNSDTSAQSAAPTG